MVFMKLRGQLSLELFLVLGLFAITLFWLNNYYQQFSSSDLLYAQQNSLAHQLAFLAGESFASQETVVFALPCFSLKGERIPFWVDIPDDRTITVRTLVPSEDQSVTVPFELGLGGSDRVFRFDCSGENAGSIKFVGSESKVLVLKGA